MQTSMKIYATQVYEQAKQFHLPIKNKYYIQMKIKKLVYSTLLIVVTLQGYSQKAKVAAADKKYDRYAYVDAIATYERVAEKGYKDEKMFQKLGNAHYFNAELEKAAKWYANSLL
jgi:hypothetical protein